MSLQKYIGVELRIQDEPEMHYTGPVYFADAVDDELQRHKRAIEWLFDRLPPACMDEGPPSDIADLINGQS